LRGIDYWEITMRKKNALFVAGLMLCASAAQAAGNINGTVGIRQLDKDFWGPVDQQAAIGVVADFALGHSLPLYISVGGNVSVDEHKDDFGDATGAVFDMTAGFKVMPRSGVFRPYAELGVASVGADLEFHSDDYDDGEDDDQSFGYYAGFGALFRIGRHFNLGANVRWIAGTSIELFGQKTDADSFIGSVVIGYGWD
jgi:hypothetical protein